ncbi:MAG: phosphotransferase [Pseudomonadota bacterium]
MQRLDNAALTELVNGAGLDIKAKSISPMSSPSTNNVFKIESENGTFILKHFLNTDVLPVNRTKQYDLQSISHGLQLAPRPLWLSNDNKWMIEQYVVPGGAVPSISILAKTLSNIHQHTAVGYELEIVDKWQAYCECLEETLPLRQALNQMIDRWQAIQKRLGVEHVLCHNDLQFVHLTGLNNVCLDWEYAGHHCRFFDICCCIKINSLSQQQSNQLLSEYAKLSDLSKAYLTGAIEDIMPFAVYTSDLWSAVVNLSRDN